MPIPANLDTLQRVKPVSFAVIGCGVIGRMHLKAGAKAPQVNLAAVADVNGDAAQNAATEYGVARATTSAQELFDDPAIEAVVLALPTNIRASLAQAAFRAGKHVLIEKPAAMSAAELESILALQGDRVGGCCSCRPHTLSTTKAARAFVASGALGQLRLLHCRASVPAGPPPGSPPPVWRLRRDLNGGGILVNWGVYDLDFLLGMAGWSLEPEVAFGAHFLMPPDLLAHQAPGSDAETHAVGCVRFKGGAVLHFERGERVPASMENTWAITGDRGTVRLTSSIPGMGMLNPQDPVYHDRIDPEKGVQTSVLHHDPDSQEDNHDPGPIVDFAEAIQQGRPPLTTLENALTLTRITDALYRSAASGRSEPI
ncbi:MAG: Gfo/Idh/MocA family protein [Opitutales bacterium]